MTPSDVERLVRESDDRARVSLHLQDPHRLPGAGLALVAVFSVGAAWDWSMKLLALGGGHPAAGHPPALVLLCG